MLAAVSLVSPWFNLLTALGNLFGLGAGSLVSRFMGAQREGEIRYMSSFSLWCGILVTALFFRPPSSSGSPCWASSESAGRAMPMPRATSSGS